MESTPDRRTVVMVDDDSDDYYFFRNALERYCAICEVVLIGDSTNVTSHLEELGVQPAFVLLDLHMPKKGGFEVLQELRAHPRYAYLPVVIFTSSLNPADQHRSEALGANLYVEKPVDVTTYDTLISESWKGWLSL